MTKGIQIAVTSGGTGGLCLAQGLRQAGIAVDVYERARTRTERLQGYRVHINPHGAAALHECLPAELWEKFVATCGSAGDGFGFLTERLKRLALIEADITAGRAPRPERNHHSASRITLHQVLSAGMPDALHYDKEFVRYERTGDGRVRCHFADGGAAEADVVVGADGANSRVRAQYLPHAERVDTGVVAIAGKFPLTEEAKRSLPPRLYRGPNSIVPPRGCGMFVAPHELTGGPSEGIGGNDETAEHDPVLFDNTGSYLMWAYAAGTGRLPGEVTLSTLDGDALRAVVEERIAGWHPQLRRLVAETPGGTVSLLPIRTSVPPEPWQPSTVTLLGDAIHSMTPFRGIGANVALRDAELLCRNLVAAARGEREIVDAIGAYEREMTGYGFAAVRDSLRAAEQFVSGNAAGRLMFKTVLRFFDAVPPLKRRVFGEQGS